MPEISEKVIILQNQTTLDTDFIRRLCSCKGNLNRLNLYSLALQKRRACIEVFNKKGASETKAFGYRQSRKCTKAS